MQVQRQIKCQHTKLYVPVISTPDNAKLLEQLKPGFKRTINWNKYQSNVSIERQNQYLDYLIDPSFQEVNRLFVLSFEENTVRARYNRYFLPTREIKDYYVMIVIIMLLFNGLRTSDNIYKITTGQGNSYKTDCLQDYFYFEKYKFIATDLSKQQKLDDDPKALQQINFIENLKRDGNTTTLLHYWRSKGNLLDFSRETVTVL